MKGVNFSFDGNYLVAEIEDISGVIKYQMEMLTHAEIKYLLPVKKQMSNNRIYLYYEIAGKMSLDRLISHKKMPDTSYINFAKGALQAVRELGEYQLSSDGLVLDHRYVFVHLTEYVPYFVYLPICDSDNGIVNMTGYLKNMLVSDMVDIKSSNIMQQTISILNSGMSVDDMLGQFNKVDVGVNYANQNYSAPQPTSSVHTPKPEPIRASAAAEANIQERSQSNYVKMNNPVQNAAMSSSVSPASAKPAHAMPIAPKPINRQTKNNKQADKEKVASAEVGAPDMKRITPVLVGTAVAVVIVFAAIASVGTFNDENGNMDYASLVAIPILIVAADYFIYSKLKIKYVITGEAAVTNEKKAEKKKTIVERGNKEVFVPVTEVKAEEHSSIDRGVGVSQTINNNTVPRPSYPQVSNISEPQFNDFGKTEILMADEISGPYLQNRRGEKINISGQITRFGKLKEQVDVVIVNPKVSRVHADIIVRDGKMYVMDLSSANGTYINGNSERITSNMEYELHDNDRVVFANEEYTVHC